MSMIGACDGSANDRMHEPIAYCLCGNIEEGKVASDYCPLCRMLSQAEDMCEVIDELVAERQKEV